MSKPLEVSDPAGEGKVDWNGAAAYMTGAGEDEAGSDKEAPEAAEVREFKYRGKTVKVDAATHALLEDLKRDARGANGRLGSELSRTRERLAKLEGIIASGQQRVVAEPDLKAPDPLLATRDIAAWQREWEAYQEKREAKIKADLETKYLGHVREVSERVKATQEEKEWADRFYDTYDHLDHADIKPIVAQVYTEHKNEIDALAEDPETAYERLAELTDQRLIRLRAAGKDTTPTNDRRPPRIESAAGATPRPKVEDTPREFSAASWIARQRLKMQGREMPKER